MKKIYLGPSSSFSQIALKEAWRKLCIKCPFSRAVDVEAENNDAVLPLFCRYRGEKALAILAAHTKSGGRILEPFAGFLDLLDYADKDLHFKIAAGFAMNIRFALMARKGVKIQEIEGVLGHNRAIQACQGNLARITPYTDDVSGSNSIAARSVARQGMYRRWAALAPAVCAREFGLEILAEDMADSPAVTTFYALVTDKLAYSRIRSNKWRVLAVFELENRPAALFKFLRRIKRWNLAHLPNHHHKEGRYRFGVEFDVLASEVPQALFALHQTRQSIHTFSFPIVSLR